MVEVNVPAVQEAQPEATRLKRLPFSLFEPGALRMRFPPAVVWTTDCAAVAVRAAAGVIFSASAITAIDFYLQRPRLT